MTPKLRSAARERFPTDPMLLGEEVLSPDGRFRAFTPMRIALYREIADRIKAGAPKAPTYLCMEQPGVHRKVLGAEPPPVAALGDRLARG